MKKHVNILIIFFVFALVFILLVKSGLIEMLHLDSILALRNQFLLLGSWSILAYFLFYIAAVLFILPVWPITVMGGALFGPVFGTIYTVFAASIALGLSFLISRYVFRSLVVLKFGDNEAFKKIDAGVKQEAWRILVFTRLVPVFSFSIQNYIYGLTNINFLLYWILSTIFIIPGTLAYTMSVGAVLSNEFSTRNLIYFSIGVVTFLLVSIIPSFMKHRCHK